MSVILYKFLMFVAIFVTVVVHLFLLFVTVLLTYVVLSSVVHVHGVKVVVHDWLVYIGIVVIMRVVHV